MSYTFSIVTAVYNVEEYLEECIESVLRQDYDLSKVQMILVDDGSTDGSGAICDRYAERWPQLIRAVHKKNGGVSSARNEGLKLAEGEYVNFLDPDDKLSGNSLKEAERFLLRHGEEVDMAAMPLYFFGARKGEHWLNYKFEKGSRVIDLAAEFDAAQAHVASAFTKRSALEGIRFDARLKWSEDEKVCLQALRKRQKLGVIAGASYHYRKRGGGSALDISSFSRDFYLTKLDYLIWDTIKSFEGGPIPKFVQYTLLYDLQWVMRKKAEQIRGILSSEEWEWLKERSFSALAYFDDDVILAQRQLEGAHKAFLLTKKRQASRAQLWLDWENAAELQEAQSLGASPRLQWHGERALFFVGGTFVYDLSVHRAYLAFLRMERDHAAIEGFITFPLAMQGHEVQVFAEVNGQMIGAEMTPTRQVKNEIFGEATTATFGFTARIPYGELGKGARVAFAARLDGQMMEHKAFAAKFFPVAFTRNFQVKGSYARAGNFIVSMDHDGVTFERSSFFKACVKELKLLKALWRFNKKGSRRAACARILYWLLKPLAPRHIWLVSDRINKADDNGEAFFKYLRGKRRKPKSYFVISGESPDYKAVRQCGPALKHLSARHKMAHLLAEAIVSSAGDDYVFCPLLGRDFYRDLLYGQKRIFLQHGIIKDDLADWLNRFNKDLSIFVTAARPECESVLRGGYFYNEDVVRLTGLARYDRLYDKREKVVTIMPTWRQWLRASEKNYRTSGVPDYGDAFFQSGYFRFYDALINDSRLLDAAKSLGYTVQFMPHPMVIPYIGKFRRSEGVRFCSIATKYRDVFAESSLAVTDYSSAVFDFAYLKKPVIYVQFDKEEFFGNHMLKPGYFDYERDGFGEVVYGLDSLVQKIIGYMQGGCQLKEVYRERIDRFFAYHDQSNCERIYEAIQSVVGKK